MMFLGVDGGGTKTQAVVADGSGAVRGRGLAGSSNYHDCGRAGAEGQIRRAVEAACAEAGISPLALRGACFGLSGADRPKDFEFLRSMLEGLLSGMDFRLENDTLLALRAGSPEGVGVAVVAGTGSNVVGRNARGETLQVGGLGPICGDRGGAPQLGLEAVVAAFMGLDGRAPATVLARRIEDKLGLGELADIIELDLFDTLKSRLDLGQLAPLVFEAAAEGDSVARRILADSGRALAASVRVAVAKLFADLDELHVVFGGSVMQKGASPLLIDSILEGLSDLDLRLCERVLDVPPVLGAVLFALDDAGLKDTKIRRRLAEQLGEAR